MQRTASLLKQAASLRLALWNALPWGYRLATVLVRIGGMMEEAWGKQIGTAFLTAGVSGMPDPGPRWNPHVPNPSALPSGYMKELATKAYKIVLQHTRNPLDAQDIMQDAILDLVTGKMQIKAFPLSSAQSFFLRGVANRASNFMREKRRKHEVGLPTDEEGKALDIPDEEFLSSPHWYDDPDRYRDLDKVFDEQTWQTEVVPMLRRVHPDMPIFFEKMLSDPHVNVKSVVQELPTFDKTYQTWFNLLRGKVAPALKAIAERNN